MILGFVLLSFYLIDRASVYSEIPTLTYVPSTATAEDQAVYLLRITEHLEKAFNNEKPTWVVWTPDGAGFGNQCRGMSSSLALALVTERAFLMNIDSDQSAGFFDIFNEPSDRFSINARENPGYLASESWANDSVGVPYRLGIPLNIEHQNNIEKNIIPSTKRTIHFRCGCTFAPLFFAAKYRSLWKNIFGADLRWDEIETLLLQWLFQNPTRRILDNVAHMKNLTDWNTYQHHLVIQYRSWVEVKMQKSVEINNLALLQECFHVELTQLVHAATSKEPLQGPIFVYVTSDARMHTNRIVADIKKWFPPTTFHPVASPEIFTQVHFRLYSVPNTHILPIFCLIPPLLCLLFVPNLPFVSNHPPPPPIQGHSSSSKSQLSSSFSDKHMNSSIANLESMVDWYLMGEAPLSICTGSSFCLSARARTGLGRSTWKMDADTDSSVIAGEGHTNTITCPNKYGEIFNYLHRPPYNRSLHVPNLPLPWFYKAMFHYAQ